MALRPRRLKAMPPALAALVLLLASTASAEAVRLPVAGVDPLPDAVEVESRSAALARWVSRGYQGAVLLYFDTLDGMRPLAQGQEAALAEMRKGQRPMSTAAGLPPPARLRPAFERRFAAAAVSLGIAREAYWVMPFDYFRSPEWAEALRSDLKKAGFLDEDLRTFTLREGCFRGTVRGTPFAVCGQESLPRITDPVLLAFEADFVVAAAAEGPTNPEVEIRKLLAALAARRYALLDLVMAASVENGAVRPDLRWVGETLVHALRDPAYLSRPDPPRRLKKLQDLAVFNDAGQYYPMFHEAQPFLAVHADDPALQLYAAEALAGQGRLDEALPRALEACRLHPGYCAGLPWLGLQRYAAGDIDGGERLFAAGSAVRPDMSYGQLDRGMALLRKGLYEEALDVFQVLSDRGEAFPAGFLAGAIYVQTSHRAKAIREFDRALEALGMDPDAEAAGHDTVQAIRQAVRLYREEGQIGKAKLLEENPRLHLGDEEDAPGTP